MAEMDLCAKWRIFLYLRRRIQLQQIFLYEIAAEKLCASRTLWVKKRNQNFWYETMCNYLDDDDWIENIRMSKDAFNYLCQELSPFISKEDMNFRKCIPVKVRVAVTYVLTTELSQICLVLEDQLCVE